MTNRPPKTLRRRLFGSHLQVLFVALLVLAIGVAAVVGIFAAVGERELFGRRGEDGSGPIGLHCVYSKENVARPEQACEVDGSLNCAGYGSSVAVTAAFGMAAAAAAIEAGLHRSA